jgi:N-acetylmuramic acid 6-phosphate (MurNAc-6-P) etherase
MPATWSDFSGRLHAVDSAEIHPVFHVLLRAVEKRLSGGASAPFPVAAE